MTQLDEYQVFNNLGQVGTSPNGYKKIRVYLVFDAKHDGRHKAQFVANRNLTKIGPLDLVYAGVVSM